MKLWKIATRGYVALGTGDDPATQADANLYDTPPYGYIDLAVQRLGIHSQEGYFTFSNEQDAQAVAEYITTEACADCYGVAVRSAEVVEIDEDEEEPGEGHCIECGAVCPPEDQICGHCAAANRDTENSVNEQRDI